MRCFAYIRVSSVEQDENVQRDAIDRFASEKGIEILGWYVDKGASGVKMFSSRSAAQELLKNLDIAKPDCIIAWSIDRLGRNMLDIMNTVLGLEERGVKVLTIKEDFMHSMDPTLRKLVLSAFAWVAEFERKRIRERIEEAWRSGKQKGRPRKIEDREILAYLRRYQGLSLRAIWKIMRSDGKEISYSRLTRRVKKLSQQRG
jgi:DNA invertase Pin-like site-specific DNA recombinase